MATASAFPPVGPTVVTAASAVSSTGPLSAGVLPPEAPPGSWSRMPRVRLSRSRTSHSLIPTEDDEVS